MKVAVCLSGRPYGIEECAENIIQNIVLPNKADVFCHAWHDESLVGTRYKTHKDFPGRVPSNLQEKIQTLYSPKTFCIEKPINFPTDGYDSIFQPGNKDLIVSVQSMFYSIRKSFLLSILYDQYDIVCRCRYDLLFEKPIYFDLLNLNTLNLYDDCKHDDTCCNDHFAVANSYIMAIYADTYQNIERMYKYGIPWCPEVFLGQWMEFNNIQKRHLGQMKYRQFK